MHVKIENCNVTNLLSCCGACYYFNKLVQFVIGIYYHLQLLSFIIVIIVIVAMVVVVKIKR